jgi:hypothetical protein
VLGRADHVRLHPGRGIGADDLQPRLAQAPRDVAAAGRHVERGASLARPLHDQVEILALALLGRVSVGVGPLAPQVRH